MREALKKSPVIGGSLSPAARAMVRRAWTSPDKTTFLQRASDERAAEEAVSARYLAPLSGHDDIWRITARGEAYMAALMRAH
ncbi:hypothetical protein [Shinella zoogloeoides]|uniref:hypothetical protein n=1 Tax=Shinella zoogloeoides TaxID=352475 RepID=UPI001F5A8252|nr:hypothetical protein [Shinella zoogloeoides]